MIPVRDARVTWELTVIYNRLYYWFLVPLHATQCISVTEKNYFRVTFIIIIIFTARTSAS